MFNEHLATVAKMSDERWWDWDPYQTVYENAERQVFGFVVELG
jgi:hypothetical protein